MLVVVLTDETSREMLEVGMMNIVLLREICEDVLHGSIGLTHTIPQIQTPTQEQLSSLAVRKEATHVTLTRIDPESKRTTFSVPITYFAFELTCVYLTFAGEGQGKGPAGQEEG